MASTLQVRIDDELKKQATALYEELGMDLSTAIRMFLKRSVAVNGVPFDLINDNERTRAQKALDSMNKVSRLNGNNKLDLESINEEISKYRKERIYK